MIPLKTQGMFPVQQIYFTRSDLKSNKDDWYYEM
jgi:hypothetical protein